VSSFRGKNRRRCCRSVSAVKLFRYKTTAEVGERDTLAFDPITVEGDIYSLIYRHG